MPSIIFDPAEELRHTVPTLHDTLPFFCSAVRRAVMHALSRVRAAATLSRAASEARSGQARGPQRGRRAAASGTQAGQQ